MKLPAFDYGSPAIVEEAVLKARRASAQKGGWG